MSQHLHSLKVGDKAEFKGALPILPYRVGQYSTLGLVAGGLLYSLDLAECNKSM